MKLLLTLFLLTALTTLTHADNLVLIKLNTSSEKQAYFNNPSLKIHFQNDIFLIASTNAKIKKNIILLDKNAWEQNEKYSIVYVSKQNKSQYLASLNPGAKQCYSINNMLIIKHYEQIKPAKNDGMIRIMPNEIKQKISNQPFPRLKKRSESDHFIDSLMGLVSAENLQTTIQHLEDYGTRIYNTPEAALAETWIKEKYEALGLEVSTQDFPQTGSSDNVIAMQTGTKYPDEYIICGAHYDSYNNAGGDAPGADDNASGNSGILEIARILSQQEFDRSIIYCAWSAEEIGLIGSSYYAVEAAENEMDIVGYFNLDMIGYLKEGTEQHIDMLYADNAEPLAQFFMDICSIYFPEMPVERKFFSYGDSDHTSFNNNGYMGIFPFEDIENYSPHIHTDQDLIGPSVNNFDMASVYVKATLASIATMADMQMPPKNLMAQPGDGLVKLKWDAMQNINQFNLYRDSLLIAEIEPNLSTYSDSSVSNEVTYHYHLTCIYTETETESEPSNTVTVTPMPPLSIPYYNDFETGIQDWSTEGDWGTTEADSYSPSTSIDDSPNNHYNPSINASFTLRGFSIPESTENISMSFNMRYDLEWDYDYLYLEINTQGEWENIDTYNGKKGLWEEFSYSLNDFIGEEYVMLRFRIESDNMIEKEGVFIDDFSINTEVEPIFSSPANLMVDIETYDNVNITWEAPEDAIPSGYILYRNDSALFTAPQEVLSYLDSNYLEATEYCYKASAIYDTIESEFSNKECFEQALEIIQKEGSAYILYPNPAKDKITISAKNMESISIFTLKGKFMVHYDALSETKNIDLEKFESGIYLIQIKTPTEVTNIRLIIE